MGAPLAGLQAHTALEELTERLPSLRLIPSEPPVYLPNLLNRRPQRLKVAWRA